MNDFESRGTEIWPEADIELRTTGDGLTLEGYAAVFNMPSLPLPGPKGPFVETIKPGAFSKTLSGNPDVTLRYQHNLATLPLARTRAGTLTLSEDERGLRVSGTLPDNEIGRPVRDAIRRGDIRGMSFSFRTILDGWTEGGTRRELQELALGPEVSVVDYPAYPDTSVYVRHLAEEAGVEPDALEEVFRILRDPDARLTAEQRDLVMAAVNVRVDEPFVGPRLVRARERLAALA